MLAALAAYMNGIVSRNNFSILLIAFGAGTVFPSMLLLGFIGIRHGRLRAAESFTAVCIASKAPVVVAIVLIAFGAACLAGAWRCWGDRTPGPFESRSMRCPWQPNGFPCAFL
jgi:hypothetical protein